MSGLTFSQTVALATLLSIVSATPSQPHSPYFHLSEAQSNSNFLRGVVDTDSYSSQGSGISLSSLNPITEWRRNLSSECLESDIWSGDLDQARQIYIFYLAECVTSLPGHPQTTPLADLNATVCDDCSSDLNRICEERGGTVCAVDVIFERDFEFPSVDPPANGTNATSSPELMPANFKYRFYECVPAECGNAADEAVFAAGWIEDLEVTFGIEEENVQFETFCPRNDEPADFTPGEDDTILACDVRVVSRQCAQEFNLMYIRDAELNAAREEFLREPCPCYGLPSDIGDVSEREWGCLCHVGGREFAEQCLPTPVDNDDDDEGSAVASGDEHRFCSYSMAWFRADSEGGVTHFNLTTYECIPSGCDNEYDRYFLEQNLYEFYTQNDGFDQFAGRFESHCYNDAEGVSTFFFTEECERAEEEIRDVENSREGLAFDSNAEDNYRDAANDCMHDALRAAPTEGNKRVADCTVALEPYQETCARVNNTRMCSASIQFTTVFEEDSPAQEFDITIYQCVPEQCSDVVDRLVYEQRDKYQFSSVLRVPEEDMFVLWDCPPLDRGEHSLQPGSQSEAATSNGKNSSSAVGIGLGVTLAVVVTAVVLVAGIVVYKRRKQGHTRLGEDDDERTAANPTGGGGGRALDDDHEAATHDITEEVGLSS